MRLVCIGHAFRPDVEAASQRGILLRTRNFPHTPNALAFVVTQIEDVVLPDVAFGPGAFAIRKGILTIHREIADIVSAFAGDLTLAEGEM